MTDNRTDTILAYVTQALEAVISLGPVVGGALTLWKATNAKVEAWIAAGTDPTDADFTDLESQITAARAILHAEQNAP